MTLPDLLAIALLTTLTVWLTCWVLRANDDTDDGSGDDPGPY